MIFREGREISGIRFGGRLLSAVHVGARLVWQAVNSCFGAGFWQSMKPWRRSDGWRRN